MRTLVTVFILYVILGLTGGTDAGSLPDTAVSHFLQRDLIGARLSGEGWRANMAPLVAWDKEPGWDLMVVIAGYESKPSRRAPDGLRAVVKYQVLGELQEGQWIPRKMQPEPQRVDFLLERKAGTWRIRHPILPPHVSVNTAIHYLRTAAAEFQQADRQQRLQESLKRLRAMQGGEM